jgi:Flp pilus assembly protein TadD
MEEITQANVGFYWNQVFTFSKENKNQEAIAILDKLLKLKPDESCLHCQKGVCLYNVKSYDEALVS